MSERLILHEYAASGNCYKVRLTAAIVGKHLERREYDIMKDETRTPQFLMEVNANGRIPVLQVDHRFIPESNAACYFIADGSNLIPTDGFDHADMLRWMFWEQYNHEPNIATLRFWKDNVGHPNLTEAQKHQIPGKREAGEAALKLMDKHLEARDWFVAGHMTLADVVLFPYTHVAHEAGFEMHLYPRIGNWLERVKGQPNWIPLSL
ncbi:MAG TPA: glutathione S-transferase family protein [Sphingomicrobium sp.]|nr:glutathione S-transferase family protein [Sphingomicrobium sp.]